MTDCAEQLHGRLDARGTRADFLEPDDGGPGIPIFGSVQLWALEWYHIALKHRAGGGGR